MHRNSPMEQRVINHAKILVSEGLTIREIAEVSTVSKSTVFKDLTDRLPEINPQLYIQVRAVLEQHRDEAPIRGGQATSQKFKEIRLEGR